jgi:exonuclease SbcC
MSSPQTTASDLTAVADAIRDHDRFVITTHENPDGDALGSLLASKLALEQLGKDTVMVLHGDAPLPNEYAFMQLGDLQRRWPDDVSERVLLAVDCANESRIADPEVLGRVPLSIDVDHHHDNTRFGRINLIVADASDLLLDMSSGQFELRMHSKDIEVIDHNDADSTRPVRTLSGGETFQASLALALALSRQVASLAASGAAKLESIFLDEGFGTLDETSLDVVAATLENLAGERMVGVITHVPALADRIPVRFQVTRTGARSQIERITA